MALNPKQIIELCERIQDNLHKMNGLYTELCDNVRWLDDSMNCSELTARMMEMINKAYNNSYETTCKTEEVIAYIVDEMEAVLTGIAPPTMLKF